MNLRFVTNLRSAVIVGIDKPLCDVKLQDFESVLEITWETIMTLLKRSVSLVSDVSGGPL